MQNTSYIRAMFLLSSITLLTIFANIYGQMEFTETNPPILKQVTPSSNSKSSIETKIDLSEHKKVVQKFYEVRKTWVTSNLGTYMFKNVDGEKIKRLGQPDLFFNVMIWKHWDWLKHRHWNSLDKCSVKNCAFSGNPDFESADAVVVHIQKGLLPKVEKRDPRQIWIFLSDESPVHTFTLSKKVPKISRLANIFNWSMTYRTDSDIPVPYGRTVALSRPKMEVLSYDLLTRLIPYWKKKRYDILATILISNCKIPYRMKFVKDLKNYVNINVFGGCAQGRNKRVCPGHSKRDCKIMSQYLFYLVLENSKCRQYISEKSFHHAYEKGAIPVIVGVPLEDCYKLLPPNSFLHIDNFKSIKHLALKMIAMSQNITELLAYHEWRNHFEVLNEHGYLQSHSMHFCRICEALNYNNDSRKVYDEDDIRLFLDSSLLCSAI